MWQVFLPWTHRTTIPVASAMCWQHVWHLNQRWTISSQVLLQGGKLIKFARCHTLHRRWFSVSQLNICSKLWVCCAMWSWALSWRRITLSLWRSGHFLLPTGGSLCSTDAVVLPLHICLKSHDHEYYRPPLYTPIEFEMSMSSVSWIKGLENFHNPSSYVIQNKKGKLTLRNWKSL
jgi:hypothetical protein